MDGEAPSWLDKEPSSNPAHTDPSLSSPPPPSPVDAAVTPSAPAATDNVAGSILASVNSDSNVNSGAVNEAGGEDLPRVIFLMRVLNMSASILLVTSSILAIIPSGTHLSIWIMAFYAMCGGVLVCCLETQLKFVRTIIAMNFGFLFHSAYRFMFYCLMASVTWSYHSILGYVTAGVLGGCAVFNTYVLCRYPAYRKMREKIAGEEDKRIQAKINQQVRKQAVNQMGWGKN